MKFFTSTLALVAVASLTGSANAFSSPRVAPSIVRYVS